MKILHVVPSIHPKYGGPSKAVVGMCTHQKKQGVDAEIATTHYSNDGPIRIEGTKIYSFRSYLKFGFSPELRGWLKKNIKKFDLIHIHTIFCYSTLIASKEARKANVPYIIRTIGQLYPQCLNQKKLKKSIYIELFDKKNLEKANALHFTTENEMKNVALKLKNQKSYVLPLGADVPRYISKVKFEQPFLHTPNKKILLFLSRIHPIKGLDLLLPSLKDILKNYSDWILVIAGSGDKLYVRKLRQRIRKLNLTNKVFFTGYVSGDKKTALLQHSSAFILPSYSENFGIAIVEAMQAGLPVMISDGVGLADSVQNVQAGVVFPLNKQAIRNTIENVINNKRLRLNMGKNGKKLAETKYNWKRITKKQIDIYKKIMGTQN